MNLNLKIRTYLLSFLIRCINPVNAHNFAKFSQIYKIWNNIKLDSIEGDYIEFGIFKGKSLFHSVKTAISIKEDKDRFFWGLDSFEGFPEDNHDFYTQTNFSTDKEKVTRDFRKYKNVKIIEGFFDKSIEKQELKGIEKLSFAFIDCDIYESAEIAFKFIHEKISNGGFVMMDDFTSIDKNGNYIAKSFFNIFENREVVFFDSYSNGQTFRILN